MEETVKSILDDEELNIPCPRCSKETKKKIGWLKRNREMTCSACGETFGLDTKELRREIARVDRAIRDLENTLKRL